MANVLIVEDNEILHKLLERILMIAGHRIVGNAFNGLDAIKQFIKQSPYPDLVLMDHRMPLLDGFNAMKRILSIEPSAKILFLSADHLMKDNAIAAGAAGFLTKPIENITLLSAINIFSKKVISKNGA